MTGLRRSVSGGQNKKRVVNRNGPSSHESGESRNTQAVSDCRRSSIDNFVIRGRSRYPSDTIPEPQPIDITIAQNLLKLSGDDCHYQDKPLSAQYRRRRLSRRCVAVQLAPDESSKLTSSAQAMTVVHCRSLTEQTEIRSGASSTRSLQAGMCQILPLPRAMGFPLAT